MSVQFDCVVWSLDKTKTIAKVWYPLNDMLSSVPRIYRLSEDNLTLYDAKSGLPLITYKDNSFKVLNDFTDWTLYIHPNSQTGLVELTDGIHIGVGGIVSKSEAPHCMKIFGKATVRFQDSIWSQTDIMVKDVAFIGYDDDIFTDVSFIYSGSFTGERISISNVDRIYAKSRTVIKDSDITDKNGASPMYIYGKYFVQIDNSKIRIRRYIASNYVTINDSEIYINNATTANSMISAEYNINLTNSKVILQREVENYFVGCALYSRGGNLILNSSRITIDLQIPEGVRNTAIDLRNGHIETNNSTISVTNILHALHFKCYGRWIRSTNKTLINIGIKSKREENNYRFEADILDCKVMVYVVDETVKSAEFVDVLDNSMNSYEFYEDYYQDDEYVTFAQENLEALKSKACIEYLTEYTSVQSLGGDIITICS